MTPGKKKKYIETLCKLLHNPHVLEVIQNEDYFLLQELIQDLSKTSLITGSDMLELCNVKLVNFSQKPCKDDKNRANFIEKYKVEFKDTFELGYSAPKDHIEYIKEKPELCTRMIIENVLKKIEENNS